jgi:hypothetical protein
VDLGLWGFLPVTRLDHVLEGEDDLGLEEGIHLVVHQPLNDGNVVWVSNISESIEKDVAPVMVLNVLGLHNTLELMEEPGQVLLFYDFRITELSEEGDWVAGVTDLGVHAGLVQDGREGEDGRGTDLMVFSLEHVRLKEVLENAQKEYELVSTGTYFR